MSVPMSDDRVQAPIENEKWGHTKDRQLENKTSKYRIALAGDFSRR